MNTTKLTSLLVAGVMIAATALPSMAAVHHRRHRRHHHVAVVHHPTAHRTMNQGTMMGKTGGMDHMHMGH